VFGDFLNNRIRAIGPNGVLRTIAGNGELGIGGHGRPATYVAIGGPGGLAIDAAGNVYFAAFEARFLHRVDAATGVVTRIQARR
jgi:hypothetical protein